MSDKIINCPNCGEPWSVLEVQEQECFECGYPNHDTDQDGTSSNAGLVPELSDSIWGLTTFSAIQKKHKYTYNPLL